MRYSLRTLLIVMLLAGPLCAAAWTGLKTYLDWRAELAAVQSQPLSPQQMLVADELPAEILNSKTHLLPDMLPQQNSLESFQSPMHN